jgi:Ca2+-binding EF-hand superfamily protein
MHSLRPVSVPDADAELDSAFALFDADGDGYVSLEDAHKLLRSMGTLADEDTLASLLASADANGDGRLSRAEFEGLLGQPPQ